jgi:hypothetical protein
MPSSDADRRTGGRRAGPVVAGALLALLLLALVLYALYAVVRGDPESVDAATDQLDVGTYGEAPGPALPIAEPETQQSEDA